ncbi:MULTISPECIES: tRNA pseudouridine(38-40) synthase TruA [unclassified Aureimonas]|uniref:tRNA pseudouridine(38-40) synthase TruA n=1 Tax=unclassified Aureimonas TaxID=2615206 RepID=UPI0006F2EDF8|nr:MULTISPECIES: tRNA pseudouridine(38-40) synthase TruA [unclassified Aureimonas]KQT53889.1 pseudouridine synthase [Aureimonas sp. Leaf427]KQT71669.1 pseudouridine synthase [Aureimonas sp. Leaf460]
MPRYKLTVEYDGTRYVGWQRQANGHAVQEAIETAFQAFVGEPITIFGAGRTDAGVHATGQVAHVDLPKPYRTDTIRDALNAYLREEAVTILAAEPVADTFDARFSARKRHYLYRIFNRRPPPALLQGQVWWVSKALDIQAMDKAAKRLLGTHDFNTFRSAHCQAKNPVRTLDRLDVMKGPGDEVHIHASAQSFLHNQIRSFAGSLKMIGEHRWTEEDLVSALESLDRKRCGPVAPPDGLYLTRVDYD